jgi:AcrR family transcriptional regulator
VRETEVGPDGKASRRVRLSGPERRDQIATATLALIARRGLQGATVYRIAEEVGMEPPSLYAHFSSRQQMLLAALDALFDRIANWLALSSDPNALNRLRAIAESHQDFMTAEFEGFVIPTYEFITAPRETGLSEIIGRRQVETLNKLAAVVDEGKRQGSIRPDMDVRLAAYEIMMCAWAEDVAQLMGIDEFREAGVSRRVLELFLDNMAAESEEPPTETHDPIRSTLSQGSAS